MTNNLKIITKTGFDSGDENYTFSLWKQEYLVKDDGQEIPIGNIHRMAVTPLDMEMVKNFVNQNPKDKKNHPIVEALSYIWTKEVVQRHEEAARAALEAMEAELATEMEETEPTEE